jgi:hypothetical protein
MKSRQKLAGAAAIGLAIGVSAAPLSGAHAALIYNFTHTDLGFTQGNPAQEVFKETITTDGSTITGKDSFTWTWKASTGTPAQFVAGTGIFTVLAFTTSELKLQIKLTNNSTFPADARLTALGLDVDPSVTGRTISGGSVFTDVSTSNFPAFQQVDVCAFVGNNCAGAGNNGLTNGASDTFTLDLTGGNFGPDNQHLSVDLEDIATKWQGSSPLSFELPGVPGGGSTSVPEPASLALLGFSLIGLGLLSRRKAA